MSAKPSNTPSTRASPFVVLTDGETWSFYLPAEQGSYEDRRVYKLDLFERPPSARRIIEAGCCSSLPKRFVTTIPRDPESVCFMAK